MMRTPPRALTALLFFLILVLAVPCSYAEAFQPQEQYVIASRLPLSQRSNGVDGYLEMLQDARLTPRLSGILWGTGDINIDDDPELALFKSQPPVNAVIQIVDRNGKVRQTKELERPLAKLRPVKLYGDSKLTYLLTVDYSAGFGSYSGPITNLVEVSGGHMQWVKSTMVETGKTGEISLMESLKTTWKIVDAPDGRGKQILLALCRPNWSASVNEDQDFRTSYARFFFNGAKWLVVERTVKGLSEFDQGFPSRKNFP